MFKSPKETGTHSSSIQTGDETVITIVLVFYALGSNKIYKLVSVATPETRTRKGTCVITLGTRTYVCFVERPDPKDLSTLVRARARSGVRYSN